MAKKNPLGFKSGNLQRQKEIAPKEPSMTLYDHLKGYYKPEDLQISQERMPFHLEEKKD
jgi:hypothetical protein